MRLIYTITAFLILTATSHALNNPLDITADELTVNPANNTAIFSGNVQLIQEGISMGAEKIIITSTAENKDVKSVIATQNVTFSFSQGKATGNRAEWNPNTNKIKLTGNVTLTQAGNTLSGNALTYDMISGKAQLSAGNSGRVKAVFGKQ